MSDDPFGFRGLLDAQFALSLLQINLQQQRNEAASMQAAADAARSQAQFNELQRQYYAADPNIIDLGPEDVREIKDVPLLARPE